jgi:hypothetical protein
LDTDYAGLKARYEVVEDTLSGFPGLSRTTTITRTEVTQTTGILDYHAVTVMVDGRGLRAPVERTIVVAAP